MKITKQNFIKNVPNLITSLRFVGAFCLLFLTPFSYPYFWVYTLTGITDVFDGYIARKKHLVSEFGSKLDSVADLFFYTVSIVKLLPHLIRILPFYVWIFVAVILTVRTASYIVCGIKFHRFASNHTILNKITGGFVFAVPYFLVTDISVYFCITVCVVGFLSSTEDLCLHIFSTQNQNDNSKVYLK